MKTTHLLYTSAFLAMTPLAIFPQENQSRPNLVFIMADQFRGDALGCMQKEPVQTPNLDKLAEEGILFTEAISSYPVSSPARAMLMTGMYPTANGVTGNCNSDNTPYRVELSAEAICWSDVLKQVGYSTAYIGKWHLDAPHPPYIDTYNNRGKVAWNEWCSPERRHGFDQWIAYGTYDNHLKPMYWDTEASREDFYYFDQWGPSYEADRAIEFIRKESSQSDQSFALVISMNPPHTGYELVPDSFKQRYAHIDVEALASQKPYIPAKGTPEGDYFRTHIRNYYACITGVDENVGRIIRTLKECGVFDNTLIIFSSDHGICMGGHGIEGKNVFYEEIHANPDDMLLEKQTASAANRPARSFCRSLPYDAFTHGNERPNTFNRTILRLEPALPARENTHSPGNYSTLLLLRSFRPDIRQTRHPYFPIHLCSSIRKREENANLALRPEKRSRSAA